MEFLKQIQELIAEMQTDVDKFYTHGNKEAGTRVRAYLQQIKVLSQEMREEIQSIKNLK